MRLKKLRQIRKLLNFRPSRTRSRLNNKSTRTCSSNKQRPLQRKELNLRRRGSKLLDKLRLSNNIRRTTRSCRRPMTFVRH
jgi:hypothetical protein